MNNQLEIEALDTLIKAVQEYREKLSENRLILTNASNLCDQAMGNDAISQKHISALNNAIEELDKTSEIVIKVAKALEEDKQKALEVLEDD